MKRPAACLAAALAGIPRVALVALALLAGSDVAGAHSASDAYLTLDTARIGATMHGQWDIALRDLDFVLHLDDDGDGHLTWREVRRHQAEVSHYAYAHLRIETGQHGVCSIKPTRQWIDDHADGAYAALFFEVSCAHAADPAALKYSLFFDVDPSHRGLFVLHRGNDVATSVLSPDNARIGLK